MYSQNNEEEVIVGYFGTDFKGQLIDIGAYNPFKFSNTRKLYELGWGCSFVEPSKICFESFVQEYAGAKNVKLFNFAMGDHNGTVDFYDSTGDALSTTSVDHLEKWKTYNANFQKVTVEMREINEFLAEHDSIDFLSIDVESTNMQLFNVIKDEHLARTTMLCIEHDGADKEICNRLAKFGHKTLLYNAENLILAK